MSRLSIYETRWIDLVFENRNKEYGAYQLRRESVKSSLFALFMGLLFVASIGSFSTISNYFNPATQPDTAIPELSDSPIIVTKVDLHKIEKQVQPALPEIKSQVTEAPITKDALRDPIIVKPSEANPEIATNLEIKNTTAEPSDGKGIVGTNPTAAAGTDTGTGTEVVPKVFEPGNAVVNTDILDKMPQFPGGMGEFYKYVGNNFEKPELEAMSTIKIFVYFVIEKDGSMSNIQVKKDPGYGLGKEAVRVLKSLRTKWAPGMINSKAVRTAYNLPISVQMQ